MAKINCPECGKIISDLQEKCQYCGFPIGAFTDPSQKESDDISYAPFNEPVEEEKKAPTEMPVYTPVFSENEENKKIADTETIKKVCNSSLNTAPERKKRRVYVAAAAVGLAVAVCVGVGISLAIGNEQTNYESDISDLVETSSIDDDDKGKFNVKEISFTGSEVIYDEAGEERRLAHFESDERNTFIAVISDEEYAQTSVTKKPVYYYVYMDGGMGLQEYKLYNDSDKMADSLSEKFKVMGYMQGKPVDENILEDVVIRYEYMDLAFEDTTLVTVILNFSFNRTKTGRMFYRLNLYSDQYSNYLFCESVDSFEGKSMTQSFSFRTPKGTSDLIAEVEPLLFVEAEVCDETENGIMIDTQNYYAEDDGLSFIEYNASCTVKPVSDPPGEILYRWSIQTIENGAGGDDFDNVLSGFDSTIVDSKGNLEVLRSEEAGNLNISDETTGQFDILGFIPWKSIEVYGEESE